ncbi:MAG: ATP-binding protein [Rhizobacter sp.]
MKPTGRATTRRKTIALLLSAALAVACIWALVARPVEPPLPAMHLAAAQVLELGERWPASLPGPHEAWRDITLPDNWDRSRPDHQGYVAYRLSLPAQALLAPRLGVLLPAAGMNAELAVNGVRLGSHGPMTGQQVPYLVYTPLFFNLPRELLRGDGRDELMIVVVSRRVTRAGLAPLWVGQAEALYRLWRKEVWRQKMGPFVSGTLTAALGLYALVLAFVERSRRELVWLGLAALAGALRSLSLVILNPPMPLLTWLQLAHLSGGWLVGLYTLFALRLAQREAPGVRWPLTWAPPLIGLYLLLRSAWTFAQPSESQLWQQWGAMGLASLLIALLGAGVLTRLAWHVRRADLAALALSTWCVIAATAYDVRMVNDTNSLEGTQWRHFAALLMVSAASVLMARRYFDALGNARRMSATLQTEVDRQRAELERSFERLREVERSQAQAEERARLMRDLHDGLGLNLVSALVQTQRPDASPASLTPLLQDCLDDLRVAVDSLDDSERDPLTLLAHLRFRLTPRFEALGMQLCWHVAPELGPQSPLDAHAALQLLRIVQEALTNAIKHSGAQRVELSLSDAPPGGLCVEVSDDGQRRNAASAPHGHTARGLGNMQTRAQAIGASFGFTSGAGGSVARLVLPRGGRQAPANTVSTPV